jgi:phosphatidylserine decarboxylase
VAHPSSFLLLFIRLLHHLISAVTGWLARLESPSILARAAVRIYCGAYKVDLTDVQRPLSDFTCVADFFTRTLKEGSRQLGEGLVSPVDGTLINELADNQRQGVISFKGNQSSLAALIGESKVDARYERGGRTLLYLSPRDYHRVHAPDNCLLHQICFISGTLWPVNSWALRNIEGLFALNERVVFYFSSKGQELLLVMIGALNVGTIDLNPRFLHRKYRRFTPKSRIMHHPFSTPYSVKKGEWLGTFCLGSSVILLSPEGSEYSRLLDHLKEGPILLGTSFASRVSS